MEELEKLFYNYLDCYLTKRDINSTLNFFSKNATIFGSGIDEVAYDFDVLDMLYRRDISQAPDKVNYTIDKISFKIPADNVGIVSCEISFQTYILNQEVKLNGLRLSLVFVKTDDKWLIEHMHISLPTTAHEEGEAYPIKELEERNKVLTRLVNEKTEELQRANDELKKKIEEIESLQGLLPICSSCKKIRDEEGNWHQIEAYITKKTKAVFSHGLCAECAKKLFPEYLKK